jgi:hypothetical protein
MIKAQPEPARDLGLNGVHLGAILGHRLARLGGGELGGGAMLVGGTQKQHLVTARPAIARKEIRRKLAAHQIAEVLDPVDVRDRRGNQMPCHRACPPLSASSLLPRM